MRKYYASTSLYGRKGYAWEVWQSSKGGDRRLAANMSEKTARKVARLLNEDYDRHANAPLHPIDDHHDE